MIKTWQKYDETVNWWFLLSIFTFYKLKRNQIRSENQTGHLKPSAVMFSRIDHYGPWIYLQATKMRRCVINFLWAFERCMYCGTLLYIHYFLHEAKEPLMGMIWDLAEMKLAATVYLYTNQEGRIICYWLSFQRHSQVSR